MNFKEAWKDYNSDVFIVFNPKQNEDGSYDVE